MIYILSTSKNILPDECLDNVMFLNLLGIKLLDFSVDEKLLADSKYIILTSKNSVKSILRNSDANSFLQKKAIAIGSATANEWMEAGGEILFCPRISCNGRKLAQMLKKFRSKELKGNKVLYPCARDRLTDFAKLLSGICNVIDISVYESYEKNNYEGVEDLVKNAEKNSIFIFGSPNIYKSFVNNYGWRQDWIAISLGATTFSYFDRNIRKANANGNFKDALDLARSLESANKLGDRKV